MSELKFTQHQRDAIDVRGGNILVSAGAGSGKTAVLAERVLQLLTQPNPVPADRLIIVTYTVAAANEMKRRISDKLSALIALNPDNQALAEQQLLLCNAHISTIHSLCLSLVRDHFHALKLPPDIKLGDDSQVSVLKAEAVEEALENGYNQDDGEFLSLVEFVCTKNDRSLAELVLNIHSFISSLPYPEDFLENSLKLYSGGEIYQSVWGKEVAPYIARAIKAAGGFIAAAKTAAADDDYVVERYGAALNSDSEFFKQLLTLAETGAFSSLTHELEARKKPAFSPIKSDYNPALTQKIKNLRANAYSIIDGIKKNFLSFTELDFKNDNEILLGKFKRLFELENDFISIFNSKKQEAGILDYSDLEHMALNLLRNHDGTPTDIGRELSEYYQEIMVDECQDINLIQQMIFEALSKNNQNIYMVGDVKQSIYRFRQADPTLFIDKRKRFSSFNSSSHTQTSEEYISLETNFRSRKEICSIVNHIFSMLMNEEATEIDYSEGDYLVNGAEYPDNPDAAPELHIIDCGDNDNLESEGEHIAALIEGMVRKGYQVKTENGVRGCSYRDFAILVRTKRATFSTFSQVLERHGIPFACEETNGYFDEYEVMVTINLLKVIDNPLLDIPLLSVLNSPLFSITPQQLAEIRLVKRNAPLYSALIQSGKYQHVLDTIEYFKTQAALLPLSELIREIYDKTSLLDFASVLKKGENGDGNLKLLLTHARNYEDSGGGLSGFLRYIDRLMQSGKSFSAANHSAKNADCVKIMSIHASKGLEFPICIIADCSHSFNMKDINTSLLQAHRNLGVSMRITDENKLRRHDPFSFEAIQLKRKNEALAEELRVLYVALTRAKEKLIMTSAFSNAQKDVAKIIGRLVSATPSPYEILQADSFAEWLISAFLCHPQASLLRKLGERDDILPIKADFPLKVELYNAEIEANVEFDNSFVAECDETLCNELQKRFEFVYPNEERTLIPQKLTVTQIAKQKNDSIESLKALPSFMQRQRLSPAERGTILHKFMQLADFAAAKSDYNGELERLLTLSHFTKAEIEALDGDKIKAFLASPLCERILKGNSLREYKFNFFIDADEAIDGLSGSNEKIFVQGIADCIIIEDDGITIVDYKTDRTNDDNVLKERYYDQLRLYKSAIQTAFDKKVNQCLIYSLHMEKEIEIEIA